MVKNILVDMDFEQERIEEILDVLLQYTLRDYSRKVSVSEEGNELDAIAVGINTIGEEVASHLCTLEEQEEELKQTNEELKLQQKELESFSYSVSHDLRAPLRAISGFSQIMMKKNFDQLDETGRRYLNNISDSAQKMGQLIDDILAFSKLGRQTISAGDFNLKNLFREVYNQLIQDVEETKITLTIEELPVVNGDYNLFKQVVQNLLSNAIKYSSKKEESKVQVGKLQNDETEIFFVKDNGAGFDMKYYDKLFGVFQRLHRDDEFEGTGVGLALTKRILERHNGRIWAESILNEGTTFFFTINENNSNN